MIKKNTNSTEDVRKEMPTEKLCPLSPIRFFFCGSPFVFFFAMVGSWQPFAARGDTTIYRSGTGDGGRHV